jgi:predicted extracellular nuclease
MALLCLGITRSRAQGTPTVFINEIHYDNTGTDAGEFIEIAGPAGTNLADYSIILYNGSGGASYDTKVLTGSIPDQMSGFGTAVQTYPVNGIQNGSPDGVALVFQGTTVVQFLSYEGPFVATNGPASGMTATDIVVTENGSGPVGESLRLIGTGTGYSDFTWAPSAPSSAGLVNQGQTFSGTPGASISISDVTVAEGNSGTTTATFVVTVTGAHPAGVTFDIATDDGTGANAATAASGDYVPRSLVAQSIPDGVSTFTFDVTVNGDTVIESAEQFVVNLSSVVGAAVSDGQGVGTIGNDDAVTSDVVISQVYGGGGNQGATLTHDFIELFNRGTSTVSLAGWSVQYLAPGASGSWAVTPLSGSIAPGTYYLIQEAPGAGGTTPLPAPDASGSIAVGSGAGKVALLQTAVASTGACPSVGFTADLVGYGAANCFEGAAPVAALSNTTAALRKRGGCFDSNNNNVDFSVGSPLPRNSAAPPRTCTFTSLAIHQIQGDQAVSPFAGQDVETTGIVTARKSNGFFIQTSGDADSNPDTSQGLFVFTSVAPAVAVGDEVVARGTATEFFGLTQLESSLAGDVTISSSGNPVPAAITLTTAILDPNGAVDGLERFEGMRLHADELRSVAPTNGFGETFTVLPGVARPVREPGIEVSLPIPPDPTSGAVDCCIPQWDENPERILIDSDGLIGAAPIDVTSHVTFTNVTGPLDFAFGDYKILPETPPVTSANISAGPVRLPALDELTIAGFNIENFANGETQRRKAALAIRQVMRSPDVIGNIEIRDLASLQALAAQVNSDAALVGEFPAYEARLIPAPQGGTQHVGLLIKTSRVQIVSATQELADQTFEDPVNHDIENLHDRPPLVLRANALLPGRAPRPFIVVVNHLRSFIDIELVGGEGIRVRAKRTAQAEATAALLQSLQVDNPGVPVVSIGDYNAYQFNDGYTDPISILKGTPTADEEIVVDQSPDLVEPNFVNLTDTLPAAERYSFIFEGTPQALDHMLLNTSASALVAGYEVARNNSDFPEGPLFAADPTRPERSSDHDMPVAYFFFPMTPVESLEAAAADLQAVLDAGATGALRARIADALKKVEKAIQYLQETPADTHQADIRIRQAAQDVEGLLNQGLLTPAVANELLQLLADASSSL